MMELRGDISKRLNHTVLESIKKAPKPTKVAEALAVVKELGGVAVSLDEIAEIINISEPGRDEKARASDYLIKDLDRHPDLLLVKTPRETLVRYVGTRSMYGRGRE
jgi:transcription initiation factor TFIIIB Brf1 subunit/transcription initiation factor TFIIB